MEAGQALFDWFLEKRETKKRGIRMKLQEAFGLEDREMVSMIGAGGKTTTLYRLANELWKTGKKVLVTTTTKLYKPTKPHVQRLFLAQEPQSLTSELAGVKEPCVVCAGSDLDGAGKLLGLPPDWLGDLLEKNVVQAILVEADGAAQRLFKVPAKHEPVVPLDSSLAVWVMGIKVLGKPLTSEWVHRAERAIDLLDLKPGCPVTMDIVERLVAHPEGCLRGIPSQSRKIALINQADSKEELQTAKDLAKPLLQYGFERIVISSYLEGDPVKAVLQG